jgi:type VI protein secretion system component VasA
MIPTGRRGPSTTVVFNLRRVVGTWHPSTGFQVAMSGYGEHEGGHEHHHHKHHHESEREERREEEEQRHNFNEGRRSHDNQGYGDEDHHGYSKSALRKEDVSFLSMY